MTLVLRRAGARPTARPWLGLALLLLPTALVAVDINVLFLALPALTADLRVSPVEQLWIVDSYGLVVGVLAIVAGSVGDRIGRRRLLLLGSAGFLVGSVVAAFAPAAPVLILARWPPSPSPRWPWASPSGHHWLPPSRGGGRSAGSCPPAWPCRRSPTCSSGSGSAATGCRSLSRP
ncbi:MAG: MFS transporter [Micromonosporaceae bacterium]|nr:MFS transporter [Micromonosporaceae bacterium]